MADPTPDTTTDEPAAPSIDIPDGLDADTVGEWLNAELQARGLSLDVTLPERPMLPWGFPDVPVHLALSLAMRDIGHAPKLSAQQRGRASGGAGDRSPSYAYRSIDDVLNNVHGPLARHGVLIIPEVVAWEREPWPHYNKPAWCRHVATIRFTLVGPRGDQLTTEVRAEALDDGDKGFGKLYSYAVKNLLLILFAVPTQPVGDLEVDGAARPDAGSWEDVEARTVDPAELQARWRAHKPKDGHEWGKYAEAWGRTLAEVRTRMGWTGATCNTWAKVNALPAEERAVLWALIPKMFSDDDPAPFADDSLPAAPEFDVDPPTDGDDAAETPAEADPGAVDAPADPDSTDSAGGAENASTAAAEDERAASIAEDVATVEANLQRQHDAAVAKRQAQAEPEPEPAPAVVPATPAAWRQLGLNADARRDVAEAFSHDPAIAAAFTASAWSTAVHKLSDDKKRSVVDWLNED